MKPKDLVKLESGHLSLFRYPTRGNGTYLGRGVLVVVLYSDSNFYVEQEICVCWSIIGACCAARCTSMSITRCSDVLLIIEYIIISNYTRNLEIVIFGQAFE